MTTAYRDTATRCRRCERVVAGVTDVRLEWTENFAAVVLVERLCTRCRHEVREAVQRLLDGEQLREVVQ